MVGLVPWRHHGSHNLQRGEDGIQAYGISCRWQEHMLRTVCPLSSSLLVHLKTGASLALLIATQTTFRQTNGDKSAMSSFLLNCDTESAVVILAMLLCIDQAYAR